VVNFGDFWENMKKPQFKARFTVGNTHKMALPDIPLGLKGLVDISCNFNRFCPWASI